MVSDERYCYTDKQISQMCGAWLCFGIFIGFAFSIAGWVLAVWK